MMYTLTLYCHTIQMYNIIIRFLENVYANKLLYSEVPNKRAGVLFIFFAKV